MRQRTLTSSPYTCTPCDPSLQALHPDTLHWYCARGTIDHDHDVWAPEPDAASCTPASLGDAAGAAAIVRSYEMVCSMPIQSDASRRRDASTHTECNGTYILNFSYRHRNSQTQPYARLLASPGTVCYRGVDIDICEISEPGASECHMACPA